MSVEMEYVSSKKNQSSDAVYHTVTYTTQHREAQSARPPSMASRPPIISWKARAQHNTPSSKYVAQTYNTVLLEILYCHGLAVMAFAKAFAIQALDMTPV